VDAIVNPSGLPTETDLGPIKHLAVAGSRAYGLENKTSDWDFIGFYVKPKRLFLGVQAQHDKTFSWKEPAEIKVHEIGQFLRLLEKSPYIHESLVQSNHTGPTSDFVLNLQANHQERLISSRLVSAYRHLGLGMADKAEGMEPGPKMEKVIRNGYRALFTAFNLVVWGEFKIKHDRELIYHLASRPKQVAIDGLGKTDNTIPKSGFDLRPEPDWAWLNEKLLEFRDLEESE